MEIATIKRGESFTFKVVLNAEYDMARLKEYYLYIGGRAMTGTVNGNAITVKLRSEDTDLMSGTNKITLWLDDTILGVQKPYLGDMVVSMTNADESNSSVSEVDNALIPVTITATAITVGDIMYNYVIGRSAYQVWLDAGNEGTVEDYLTALKGKQGADGVGLNYLGTVATSANLNPSYEGLANDAFVTEDLGRAWKWTGTQWLDVGSFRGDKGDPFLYEDFTPEQLEALKVKGDKGDPFLYSDFTPEQLEALKVKGDKGDPFLYSDFTPEQLEALKVKGDKGDPFLYSDFTPEQLEALKVKGDKGDPFLYSDFTPEQIEALKVKGDKGDPFLYSDFTPEQLEALKVKGDKGDPFLYEDFTPEQLESLKVKGDKGDPLTYADMTEANKDDLRQPIYDDLLSLIYAGL